MVWKLMLGCIKHTMLASKLEVTLQHDAIFDGKSKQDNSRYVEIEQDMLCKLERMIDLTVNRAPIDKLMDGMLRDAHKRNEYHFEMTKA